MSSIQGIYEHGQDRLLENGTIRLVVPCVLFVVCYTNMYNIIFVGKGRSRSSVGRYTPRGWDNVPVTNVRASRRDGPSMFMRLLTGMVAVGDSIYPGW